MGFFSDIASEARRSGHSGTPPQPAAMERPEQHVPSQEAPPEPAPAAPEPAPTGPEPAPAPEQQEPSPELKLDMAQDTATVPDDTAARQAHEAAEAKRKAEFDARQAEKKAARQAALDKLAAMSDADAISEAAKRVGADTEKITRRNMKEQAAAHVQALCQTDPAFARKTIHPHKSMVNCFRYISRKAFEYIQDELKADGIKPGPGSEGYGCDIPDGLCLQWAVDYFNDPDAKEDKTDEEKFVPRPYAPATKTQNRSAAKKKQAAAKKPPEPKDKADAGQITLGGFAPMEEEAG